MRREQDDQQGKPKQLPINGQTVEKALLQKMITWNINNIISIIEEFVDKPVTNVDHFTTGNFKPAKKSRQTKQDSAILI